MAPEMRNLPGQSYRETSTDYSMANWEIVDVINLVALKRHTKEPGKGTYERDEEN